MAESSGAEDGWLTVRIETGRAAEVNRVLARAGIFASGLEAGSDLESLFLELTRSESMTGHEGTFFGMAGGDAAGTVSRPDDTAGAAG